MHASIASPPAKMENDMCDLPFSSSQAVLTLHSTLDNQIDSPLLRLPAELRNKIYEFALSGHRIGSRRQLREVASLRYTCRQIRSETAFMEFPLNTFEVLVGGDLFTEENIECHLGLHHVRVVEIDSTILVYKGWEENLKPFEVSWSELEALGRLKGLEKIQVVFSMWSYTWSTRQAIAEIKEVFELFRTTTQSIEVRGLWDWELGRSGEYTIEEGVE